MSTPEERLQDMTKERDREQDKVTELRQRLADCQVENQRLRALVVSLGGRP